MVDDKLSEDGVTKVGRLIAVIRDALLLCLLIVAIYFGIQSLPLIETAIKHSSIESVNLGAIVLKLRDDPVANYPSQGITVDAVGGSAEILEKGSGDLLRGLEASQSPRIELLGLSAGHTYRGDLLLAYITRLSPRFVLLRSGDHLDAWAEPGIIGAQITEHEDYPYDRLRSLRGLRHDSIKKSDTARTALETMTKVHLDHLPAVDDTGRFQFMVGRDEILAKVITSVVLAAK